MLKNNSIDTKYLGIVVDADYQSPKDNNEGFVKTLESFKDIFSEFQYTYNSEKFYFCHDDGLPDVGLWIMPNNKDDGYLECFIHNIIRADEQILFDYVKETISKLPQKKFKEHNKHKAEIATLLSWQKQPGQDLYYFIDNKYHEVLINEEHENFKNLITWLNLIFKPK